MYDVFILELFVELFHRILSITRKISALAAPGSFL